MNKLFILFALMSLIHFSGVSQEKRSKKLEARLQDMLKGFQGVIGIYVKDLKRNKIAAVNADSIFPTASMVKIPILIGIMDKLETGALQYHQVLIYRDSLLYEGVDILGSFKNDEKIELSKFRTEQGEPFPEFPEKSLILLSVSDPRCEMCRLSVDLIEQVETEAKLNQVKFFIVSLVPEVTKAEFFPLC